MMSETREKQSIEMLDSGANALEWESKSSVRPAGYGFGRAVYKLPRGILHTEKAYRMSCIPDTR